MNLEKPFTSLTPPVFNGINYHLWAAITEAHLEANDLWEGVEVPQLTANHIIAHIRNQKGMKSKMSGARDTEFEMQKMNYSETIKEYTSKFLSIANKIRLFGFDFSDSRIIQKIRVTLPERFDATISSLENTKDLSTITLAEISNAMQAQEQRRLMREEVSMEGALQAKLHINRGEKDQKKKFQKKHFHP
ncbi:hypothetical protein AgCh_021445 [Apium graveolens]